MHWIRTRLLRLLRTIQGRINKWQKQWSLTRLLKKLFIEPLTSSQPGFIRVDGKQAPLCLADVTLRPLFINPHEHTMPMQYLAAEKLLALVGATYLPRRLLLLLRRFDAFQASSLFLSACDLVFSDLLLSGLKREFFGKMLQALVEADAYLVESELSDIPLFLTISTHNIDAVEAKVEQLRKAADVLRSLKSVDIKFPAYIPSFYQDADRLIKKWHRLDDATVDEIYATYCAWRQLQENYDSVMKGIDETIPWLNFYLPDGHVLSVTVEKIVRRAEILRTALETEEDKEPAHRIEALVDILDELMAIRAAVLDEMGQTDDNNSTGQPQSDYSEEEIQRCLAVLNLAYPEDLNFAALKIAFRKLAKQHHPDQGGDEARFKQINDAYQYLMRQIQREESTA